MYRLSRLMALVVVLTAIAASPAGAAGHTVKFAVACPQAAAGHGSMGECAPPAIKRPGMTLTLTATGPVRFADTSNNDPLSCPQIRRLNVAGLVVKINQGTGFIDRTARAQIACARARGLVTGGYDFVSTYSAAEAQVFVAQLRAAGMTRAAGRWAPPTLDVEYGNASRPGLAAMIRVVKGAFGRVQIYTGNWYWQPHFGCWWPGVPAWLAGYPSAPILCGLPRSLYLSHQYTDHGFNGATFTDMSQWLRSSDAFAAFTRAAKPKPTPRQRTPSATGGSSGSTATAAASVTR